MIHPKLAAVRQKPQGIPTYNRENGVSWKCLVECLRVYKMYVVQCPTHNHLKYIFLSFLFKTFTIVHLDSFYTYTFHSFPIFSFLTTFITVRGRYTRTHPHNTASPMSKTGRRLGRETNHPTRPAGTLVRETHHPIISRKI